MPTELSKISTYVEEEILKDFRIIAAKHNKSMSAYLKEIVIREIEREKANKAE